MTDRDSNFLAFLWGTVGVLVVLMIFFIIYPPQKKPIFVENVAEKEPKYCLTDSVFYKVPKFYSKVCSGVGQVENYHDPKQEPHYKVPIYEVIPPYEDREKGCSRTWELTEEEIIGLTTE